MLPTLGVDISKDSFHVELSINNKLRHRRFANRKEGFVELSGWLTKQKALPVQACLEATGPYSEALALISMSKVTSSALSIPPRSKLSAKANCCATKMIVRMQD